MKIIPLLSLFKTSTSHTKTLLEKNFDLKISNEFLGWEYGPMATHSDQSAWSQPNSSYLVIVKNPYATLYSWYRHYRENGLGIKSTAKNFSEFIRSRIVFYDGSAEIKPEYAFANPIEMWNCVVRNLISVTKQTKGYVARHEDLLLRPEESLQAFAQWLDLPRKLDDHFLIRPHISEDTDEKRTHRENSGHVASHEFDEKTFFSDKIYLQQYRNDDLEIMSALLDKSLLKELSYEVENSFSDCEIYTVANDYMAKQLATLLFTIKQNSGFDLACVRVIPFNNDIEKVKAICSAFNVVLVKPKRVWDELGQALFKDEEYRPNVPAWRYFRKLNALSLARGKFIFLDANSLVLSSLIPVFNGLLDYDVVFGHYSAKNRNFKEPLAKILNSANPKIKTGINAGFWATKYDPQFNKFLQSFININIRPCLTRSPEQSVLSMGWALSHKKLGQVDEVCEGLCHASSKNEVEQKNGLVVVNRNKQIKKVIAMKWSGETMRINDSMPNKDLYSHYLKGTIGFLTQADASVFEEITQSWLFD